MASPAEVPLEGFRSMVDPGFWGVFAKAKLEKFKLSEAPVQLNGWYAPGRAAGMAPILRVTGQDLLSSTSDDAQDKLHGEDPNAFRADGLLLNANTVEDFKNLDKRKLLDDSGLELLNAIDAGQVEQDPARLVPFRVISYADLKRHKFIYWFCFPSISPTSAGLHLSDLAGASTSGIVSEVTLREALAHRGAGFFAIEASTGRILNLAEARERDSSELACLCMVDPSTHASQTGWPLRNFAFWAARRLPGLAERADAMPILCLRRDAASSLVVRLRAAAETTTASGSDAITATGWEPNVQGKMGPRLSDLSAQLDPAKLSQAASDLNLKLMRWRALPSLDTDRLAQTRCFLVGSGTLGCSVARCLLGWGFRKITMLDNGRVSYSNPARQSLFTHEDCANGGRPKAEAAAEALRAILPGVDAQGVQLDIPMPGHFVSTPAELEKARASVAQLEDLVQGHDVVILLTDTRESRWLPSLLGAKHDKLVLNSALGFDSFMVMRHGHGPGVADTSRRLGCYFCNDVVAPQNSMKDRTLDQQCTVTRPGLAPIAGAVLVELLVGLLHHPQENRAPPLEDGADDHAGLDGLGALPHQVRGSLRTFANANITGEAFPQCSACSACVVDAYSAQGFEMLLHAFNKPDYLEDLTGLTELRNSANLDSLLDDDLLDDFDDDPDALL
ncbi:Ubiquitin-like modifier-activating enzyme ATG7 [Hondaea fermentalgiana]|uniref:Ubiquitin-like modifier-activating enzyme ATG7 n=1 Tax=Hondaea fermentalgiana TaxID=2315210 RepID=A0A2R5GEU9_9STRA|nr:Ubiquitin-like modifier-activating enzyme ATG7 [Hondaea fermentalgiana]|eukprot:GBG26781.1 Ubiquitin-like modifier-activating enzyme ATG7 [Hondaea fermentalgiana]